MPEASTPTEWILLHTRYRSDSELLKSGDKGHSALYLAGYMAECAAKALALAVTPAQTKTHNLVALLDRARMPLQGLTPVEEAYAKNRDVALRYDTALPEDWASQIDAARRLATRLCTELNRRQKRGRR